jgi:hypothetical protein
MRYSQLYTILPCLSGEKGHVICPSLSQEMANHGERKNDTIFPLLSMEGEIMPEKVTDC